MKIIRAFKEYEKFRLDIKDLELSENNINIIIGANGCGKSTFAKIITGAVDCENFETDRKYTSALAFQKPYLLHDTVYKNIIYPLKVKKMPVDEKEIDMWLELFELKEYKHTYARSLSSGQQQKLSIIRSIIYKPDLLVIDESLSNLDFESLIKFKKILKSFSSMTVVIITHQLGMFMDTASTVHMFQDGKNCFTGTFENLLKSENPHVKRYLKTLFIEKGV